MLPETPTVLMPVEKTVGLKEKGYIDKGIGESGARELVLDNGIQVVLKSYIPSPGVYSDKIMLHGFSPKGASCASKEDYYAALLAPGIVKNAGVGAMDKFMLKRFLSNTSISVSPYIGYYETGITANAALNDVEKMLQLIYLYITTPRKDQEAFKDWKLEEQKSYYNSSSNIIQADFYNAIGEITGDSSVRRNPLSSKRALQGTKRFRGIKQANLDKAYEAYKSLFGHAKDFTFLISGAFAMDSVLPLVQKYLGNLPDISDSPQCSQKPANTDAPSNGLSYHEIPPPDYQMHNTSYSLRFMSKASDMDDWREEIKIRALGRIAMLKAWSLRFEKGYSLYDLSASGQLNKDKSRYEISINFNCELKELPLLRGDSKKIIHQIKSGQVTREILQKTFKELKSAYNQTNATTPREMQHRLYNHYRYELSWVDSVEAENYIESLTLKDIMDAANVYCKEENLFEFVMKN
ncbi:M16 family metallopeptidase [Sinomicrobium sp. M5D2P9]